MLIVRQMGLCNGSSVSDVMGGVCVWGGGHWIHLIWYMMSTLYTDVCLCGAVCVSANRCLVLWATIHSCNECVCCALKQINQFRQTLTLTLPKSGVFNLVVSVGFWAAICTDNLTLQQTTSCCRGPV